jgi:hypothetical protein
MGQQLEATRLGAVTPLVPANRASDLFEGGRRWAVNLSNSGFRANWQPLSSEES